MGCKLSRRKEASAFSAQSTNPTNVNHEHRETTPTVSETTNEMRSGEEDVGQSEPSESDTVDFKEIFNESLASLRGTTLDITPFATAERFRFIDCEAYISDNVLKIYETPILPEDPQHIYSAISYVWFGLISEPSVLDRNGWFRVYCGQRSDGTAREDGGPISMQVLHYACQWSSRASCSYLWLDRLCILQTSKIDKTWQIRRMYDVYESCQECIVLPGGLQRLASVYDETSWAERAWTYQEAIVCWQYAIVLTRDWHRPPGEQHWMIPGECHWQYLLELFVTGDKLLSPQAPETRDNTNSEENDARPVLILGKNGPALNTLRRIVEYRVWNEGCELGEEKISEHNIRQLLLQGVQMRNSSRPVDMAFSILGLVDIENDIPLERFKENDRFRATLALVEAMLRNDDSDKDEGVDGNVSGTDGAQQGCNTLLDIPLWAHIQYIGVDKHRSSPYLPTLQELASLLDDEMSSDSLNNSAQNHHLRVLPLSTWQYEVTLIKDEPVQYASAVARQIPDSALLESYHNVAMIQQRTLFEHEIEGVIELRRTLDIGRSEADLEIDLLADLFVYGWTLKMEEHPYMRFYRFDVSSLVL